MLLKREGWRVNAKRIYQLYDQEGLTVRTKARKKLASRARVPLPAPTRPNERWSMDFVSARTVARWFRTLTVLFERMSWRRSGPSILSKTGSL